MKIAFAAGLLTLALSGCASIMAGGSQPVTIKSVPDGAAFSVTNRAGEKIHAGTTPVTLTLNRGAGYFKSEVYTVVLKKEGFADRTLTLESTVNGWYVANILFGGLIGMLAVDPATGAMYSFPESVNGELEAQAAKAADVGSTLTIVSTDSLSAEAMKEARLVAALR